MRKLLFAAFVCCAALIAGPAFGKDGYNLTLSTGLRSDEFDWNIAGDSSGANPNVLSELSWRELDIYEIRGKLAVETNRVYIRGSLAYGLIYNGVNQDSDYNGDNRTLEFSRSNNRADDGSVWDISGGVGYVFRLTPSSRAALDVIPLAGFSYHRQNLTITDGFQTIPATGPFGGLNSTYEARWTGPWAGVDLIYRFDRLTLSGTFEYHVASYLAEADWNLRTDFAHPKSFEHTANGTGVVVSLGGDYAISKEWAVGGSFDYQDWRAEDGTDRTFFSDGSIAETKLNEVNWTSEALMVDVRYSF
ncbi:MAG: TonB-dependent receptor [Deltaproteobacteria bacterium]|nr:TonB-dependent receptor [Deltaproteobacteria bacterium]